MEKRIFLFKLLVTLFFIYLFVMVGAFFKCYKHATALDYIFAPATNQIEIPKEVKNNALHRLNPDFLPNSGNMPDREGSARGFREM
jgi:hypothetical protein